jgi:hypothetical protein
VGQPTIQLPPNPDFNSLSLEEKDQIYQDLHNQIDNLIPQRKSFAYKALLWGDTGPALESGLAIQKFVIAFADSRSFYRTDSIIFQQSMIYGKYFSTNTRG